MEIRVACAVNIQNEFEKKHFGDADKYMIYQWQDEQFLFQTEFINQSKDMDESKTHGSKLKGNTIISLLKEQDVNILVSKQFGKNIKMVNQHFIPVMIKTDTIDEACQVLSKNLKWLVDDLREGPDSYKLFKLDSGSLKEKIKTQDF